MTKVLIAGAGPTGLTLAVELARRRVDHLLVEADQAPAIGSRGKGLQPRSLEVLDDLGVIDEILANGSIGLPLRLHQGNKLLVELATAAGQRPGVPYPDLVMLPEWRVEQILRDRLVALGGKVLYGAALNSFTQDDGGVTATLANGQTVRARYLVGSDGGHSAVRHLLGATMDGHTQEDQVFFVGDVKIHGLAADASYAWFGEDGSYLAIAPLPNADGAWQYQAGAHPGPDDEPTLELFHELFRDRSGRSDVTLTDATWLSRYRFNARMVSSYRFGRVFLAGDAAHVHSPAGGQGMNTGIQDAYNLGWKLAAALTGAPEEILDSYGAERIPIAAKVLADSSRGFESIFSLKGVRRFLRDHVLFPLVKQPAIMNRLLAMTSQLDLAYPDSPLTVPGGPRRGPKPGDRAPDARGTTPAGAPTRLFDVTRGTHWTLLGFGPQTTQALSTIQSPHVRVLQVVASGRADFPQALISKEMSRLYRARPGTLLLIRPDGYIALRTEEPRIVDAYFDRILPPTRAATPSAT
ncbi:FAD-dependent oxidoreductase [Nonomuraea africana]|uniref:2-polyprenyl-6-methoxyphenol hydroxylase-like FAD-dependent oxidoreductase n=1 Tax=Nonomuraea africana TaxID=46171 RepID=A0ABR9KK71_9ACTN|nr:FAD-dependent monooxygenase [Nonomuraea africana]MBE1562215.1 2-polyprenyl-6-methoxyphenol hydroxylase-like FAD-dependent oxidoreductase [Nonomuraea africana]